MEDKEIFECWEIFKELLRKTKRNNIDNVIDWLDKSDFKFAPASTKYHNSFKGGLLKHSLDVYYHMYDFNNYIKFFDIPEDTIIITSLLHDVCKVNCYGVDYRNMKNENGEWVKVPFYTWEEQEALGHAEKSIFMLYECGVQLTKVERAMIRNHMGFSNDENTNRVSKLFSQCPQALILHWADESATFIEESPDLPDRFRQKFVGRNISESLTIEEKIQTIKIDNMEYRLAPQEAVVDGQKIITVTYNNQQVKVYAPYGDGLPF